MKEAENKRKKIKYLKIKNLSLTKIFVMVA